LDEAQANFALEKEQFEQTSDRKSSMLSTASHSPRSVSPSQLCLSQEDRHQLYTSDNERFLLKIDGIEEESIKLKQKSKSSDLKALLDAEEEMNEIFNKKSPNFSKNLNCSSHPINSLRSKWSDNNEFQRSQDSTNLPSKPKIVRVQSVRCNIPERPSNP